MTSYLTQMITYLKSDEIFIEYHYGEDFLVRKLKRAGFRVCKSWPIRGYNTFLKKAICTGYIQANR